MQVTFNIFSIKANGIEGSSALNVGTNLLIGFGSTTKAIEGNGEIKGDTGALHTRYTRIDDRDLVDTPSWEGFGSVGWPAWLGYS